MENSNFYFLQKDFELLYKIGTMAESYLYSDENSCLIKLGQFGEIVVNQIFSLEGVETPTMDNTHANRIKVLKNEGLLPSVIDNVLYQLRTTRNKAIHSGYSSLEDCKTLLRMTYNLGRWFYMTYDESPTPVGEFVFPVKIPQSKLSDLLSENKEKEQQIKELAEKLAEIQASQTTIQSAELSEKKRLRAEKSIKAIQNLRLSEAETRKIIDEQLKKVGWQADSVHLRYGKGIRPQKSKNLAIAEFPTENGFADYALFVGLQLVGIVEAKPESKDISAIIDNQCKEYARSIKSEHAEFVINTWGAYKAPFLFATNGRKYLKQIETKSGIWFLDIRQQSNIPRALQGWISPERALELLQKDIEAANAKLAETPYDLLTDPDGLNLRPYQLNAVKAAESAILNGKQTALLSMATGTGKTRTVLGIIYRFLRSERFSRILFLVDRTALGEQLEDVFKDVKLEELQTLNNIYNVKSLKDKEIDPETKVHVSTVQAMVKRILYNEDSDTMPSVADYDLIIVDEAHRGYIIDRDMDDDEILYRNQTDYISKYRTVIEYFDAVKIALTATPALHTTQIFGRPVFEYSYPEAVLDGFLVDHDLPYHIKTQLSETGIHIEKGKTVKVFDIEKQLVLDFAELEDELDFDIEQFNRKVITEPFNRAVLGEIAQYIDPEGEGKILIFAVDDNHADLIVKILKEIYEPQGVDNDAIMKLTGSIGDRERVLSAIKRYKNERYPNIAVTVDLLTTGIDIPEITTLVFMRRVKSRILFEQMMGRATRLCPEINKSHFDIFDPVGVYEALQEVTTMQPVAVNPGATIADVLDGLEMAETEEQIKKQVRQLIAKMQRRSKNFKQKELEYFKELTAGQTPQEFIRNIKSMSPTDAKDYVLSHEKSLEIFAHAMPPKGYKVIDSTPDTVSEVSRGYGKGEKPEDYLNSFSEFIQANRNTIAALQILCSRPAELSRKELKSLKMELDQKGFTAQRLNTAWNEVKNVEITASIIGIIRSMALGVDLIDRQTRVKNAVKKLQQNHHFSKMESNWLKRIEEHLINEELIDNESFDAGAFKNHGGFNKIDKVFNHQLKSIISELNHYLYDEEKTA